MHSQVSIEGVIRNSENPSKFVPDNDASKGLWFWIDVPEMAASCSLPRETPLIEVS